MQAVFIPVKPKPRDTHDARRSLPSCVRWHSLSECQRCCRYVYRGPDAAEEEERVVNIFVRRLFHLPVGWGLQCC